MPEGTVTARLTVEDDIGIESDTTTGTIEPRTELPPSTPSPRTETPTPVTTAATPPSTTTPTDSDPTPVASLASIPGIVGAVCYLPALIFGSYGISVTLTDHTPPVEGVRIQGLAALGILIRVLAGAVGGTPLLGFGVTAPVVWALLTSTAYVIVTRGLLDDLLG